MKLNYILTAIAVLSFIIFIAQITRTLTINKIERDSNFDIIWCPDGFMSGHYEITSE